MGYVLGPRLHASTAERGVALGAGGGRVLATPAPFSSTHWGKRDDPLTSRGQRLQLCLETSFLRAVRSLKASRHPWKEGAIMSPFNR